MTVVAAWTSPLSGTLDLSNSFMVSETNWDAMASCLMYLGGADGNTKTGGYAIGGDVTTTGLYGFANSPNSRLVADGVNNLILAAGSGGSLALYPNNTHTYWVTSAALYPSTDQGAALGTGSNRWSGVAAHDATFTGTVSVTGTVSSGAVSAGSVSAGSVSNTGAIALGQTGQQTNLNGNNIVLHAGVGNVIPAADIDFDLGGGSNRWIAVFAQNNVIQTSSRATKELLERVEPGAAMAAIRGMPVWHFHYLDKRGRPDPRFLHTGPVAEDMPAKMQVFAEHVTANTLAGWALAALQDLDVRLAALEAGR